MLHLVDNSKAEFHHHRSNRLSCCSLIRFQGLNTVTSTAGSRMVFIITPESASAGIRKWLEEIRRSEIMLTPDANSICFKVRAKDNQSYMWGSFDMWIITTLMPQRLGEGRFVEC